MAGKGKKGGGGGPPPDTLLRWPAWAIGVLALGSAFSPLRPDYLRALHWVLCVFSLLEAGVALGKGRRGAFFAYAVIGVLVNPIRPFTFALQMWRLLHAGAGIWLVADHLPGRR
jgi:hypothetical protein